jgi:hypothetical protein
MRMSTSVPQFAHVFMGKKRRPERKGRRVGVPP